MDETIQSSWCPMTTERGRLEGRERPSPDLSWVDSVDAEAELHLLPMERAILKALREYARGIQQKQ